MTHLDVLALSRDVQRIATAWSQWSQAVRRGAALDWDPFALVPDRARRAVFLEVQELDESDPLRRPLLRWVYRLAEQRINRQAAVHLALLRHHQQHGLHRPEPQAATVAQLLERLLTDAPRRTAWLEALASVGADLGQGEAALWERRQEIANQFGLQSPDDIESPSVHIATAAEQWLANSEDLFNELDIGSWPQWLGIALGRGAEEGWPARLTPRTLSALLRDTTWLDRIAFEPGELPAPVAPASFVRALAQVGTAWGEALAPERQPFVIARDPYAMRSVSFGARFALLPSSPVFARRALDVGAPRVRDHGRALGRVVLLASRLSAARVLLRRPALAGARTFREHYSDVVRQACGAALPTQLAGVVVRLDPVNAASFAGLLLGAAAMERHVEEYDEDWFRNPRAAEAFRGEAELSPPIEATREELDAGAVALGRWLRSLA